MYLEAPKRLCTICMDILNDEDKLHRFLAKQAAKNLRNAILAISLWFLSAILAFMVADVIAVGLNRTIGWGLIILYLGMVVSAGLLALYALVGSINANRLVKNRKNYIAMGLSILVLLAVAWEIVSRLNRPLS